MSDQVDFSDFVELPSILSNDEYFQSKKSMFITGENLKDPRKNKYHSEWPNFLPESLICLVPNFKADFNKVGEYLRRMSNNALVSLFFTAESFAENGLQVRNTDCDEIQKSLKWEEYIGLWTKHYLKLSDSELNNVIENCQKLYQEAKDLVKRDARTETIRLFSCKHQNIFPQNRPKRDTTSNGERVQRITVREVRREKKKKLQKYSHLYDDSGKLKRIKLDLCDCLEVHCPGCAFEECPLCKSLKCVYSCRINRKFAPHDYSDEHENFLKKFPFPNQFA